MAKHRRAGARRKQRRQWLSRQELLEVLVLISLLSLVVMAVHKLRSPETLPVRKIHCVSRLQHIQHDELREAVLAKLKGGFFNVDLKAIEKSLGALPWADTVSVRRQWPDTLLISLNEHQPVARWGKEGLLNHRGELFFPRDKLSGQDFPVLMGPQGRERQLLSTFKRLYELLLPAGLKVRALVQDERRAWHILLANGIPVAVGQGEAAKRVKRLARIYASVLAPRAAEIARIDLRYTNGLAVAWKSTGTKRNRGKKRN